MSTAIVQRDDLDQEHLDSAFWINFAFCIVLSGVIGSRSRAGGRASTTRRSSSRCSRCSACRSSIWGLGIVQEAYVQRGLQFQKLALRTNVAALAGWHRGSRRRARRRRRVGARHPAHDVLGISVVPSLGDQRLAAAVPLLDAVTRGDILGFSTSVFVANTGGWVNRRGDILLMGIFFGPTVVGIYRLADRFVDGLMELTTRPVGLVSLAHFSRLQHDPEALRKTVCVVHPHRDADDGARAPRARGELELRPRGHRARVGGRRRPR